MTPIALAFAAWIAALCAAVALPVGRRLPPKLHLGRLAPNLLNKDAKLPPFFLRGLRRLGIFTITTYLGIIAGPKAPLSPDMIRGDIKLLMRDMDGMEPQNPPPLRLRLRYAALAARAFLVCFNFRLRGMFSIYNLSSSTSKKADGAASALRQKTHPCVYAYDMRPSLLVPF